MNNSLVTRDDYRPEIDGLRAIAIMCVILFHLDAVGFAGGYLGVDMFFVISGFLITQKIIQQAGRARFRYTLFYLGRVKRLVPGLLAALLLTLIGAALIFSPKDMLQTSNALAASVFWVGNIHAYMQDSYFIESNTQPLLHLWSLGVEAQFYLLWPLLFLFFYRKSPRLCVFVVIGVGGCSYALAFGLAGVDSHAIFYLLPTRFFEFMIGAALCIAPWMHNPDKLTPSLTWGTGLILLTGGMLLAGKDTPVHATPVLLVCLGTIFVIHGARHCRIGGALFGNKLFSYVGRMSYELYLFHWPLIVFLGYLTYEPTTNLQAISLVIVCVLLSAATYHFISCPARFTIRGKAVREYFLIGSLGTVVLLLLVAASIRFSGGWVWRLPDETDVYVSHHSQFHETQFGGAGYKEGLVHKLGAQDTTPSLIVIGDSFAAQYASALDELLTQENKSALLLHQNECFIAPDSTTIRRGIVDDACNAMFARAIKLIHSHQAPVLYAHSWSSYKGVAATRDGTLMPFSPENNEGYYQFIIGSIDAMRKAIGERKLIVTGIQPGIEKKEALYQCLYLPNIFPNNCELKVTASEDARLHGKEFNIAAAAYVTHHPNVTFINPRDVLCKDEACHALINGHIIYSDLIHFTKAGAKYVLQKSGWGFN